MTARLALAVTPATPLTLGQVRPLLMTWLLARRLGGQVVLRLEGSASAEQIAAACAELHWLGLDWDEQVIQAERAELYAAAAERLKAGGWLYPCFEGEVELNAKRERRLREGRSAIYDRAMLRLTPAQRAAAEAGGKRPYWRFQLSDRPTRWQDLILGRREVKLTAMSDPVLVSAEGAPQGVFAAAVDEIEDRLTHVLRGEELLGQSGIARDVVGALRGGRITLGHLPVLAGRDGGRLSRRDGNLTVHALRQDGMLAEGLCGYLAGLGLAGKARAASPAELVESFSLAAIPAESPRFEARALLGVNRQALAAAPFAAVAERLPTGATEAFWTAVRGSLDLLNEARGYWEVVAGTIVPPVVEGEADLLAAALETLPDEPWDAQVWSRWIAALAERVGRKPAGMAAPLRLALTGEEQGPDLAALLPLIGRARAAQRLAVAAGVKEQTGWRG